MNIELLSKLSLLNGASGDESAVREAVIGLLPEKAEYKVDNLGNLIVFVKGKNRPKNKVMIEAHMDEVGFIATYVGENGLIRFSTVGGISPSVLCGKRVVFGNGTEGVIGVTPVHLLEGESKKKFPSPEDMYIDIGASDFDEAFLRVEPGDFAVFSSDFTRFGDNKIKGKALDDRAGCAVLLEIMKNELRYDTYFVFTVQEEVGLRGASAAAFTVAPDYAIIAETTTAADIFGTPEEKQVCVLGKGPAVSFMDRSTVYNPSLYSLAMRTAEKNGIAVQPKSFVSGGNDSGAVHKSRGGVGTLTVSLPCRYLHSPSCILDLRDIEQGEKLIAALAEELADA